MRHLAPRFRNSLFELDFTFIARYSASPCYPLATPSLPLLPPSWPGRALIIARNGGEKRRKEKKRKEKRKTKRLSFFVHSFSRLVFPFSSSSRNKEDLRTNPSFVSSVDRIEISARDFRASERAFVGIVPRFDRSFLDRRRGPGVEGRRRDERESERARSLNRVLKYLYAREYKSNRFIKGPERGWSEERRQQRVSRERGQGNKTMAEGPRSFGSLAKKGENEREGRRDEVYIASLPLLPFGCSIN